MFEIKVTVDLPGIPEAINNLAEALSGAPRAAKATQTSAEDTRRVIEQAPPQIVPMNAPLETAHEDATPNDPAPIPASVSVEIPETPKKVYTFDEISRAGAALCNQGVEMTDRLVALLQTKYGVDSIVELGEEHYNELAADLEMFGAQMG